MRNSSQKGFTLVEVAIAMGLSAVVLAVVVTSIFNLTKNQSDLSNKVAATVDALLGEQSIFVDLRNIEPSFNNVIAADDSNLSFFEHYPDIPESMIANKSRTITLSLNGKREFYFLQTDIMAGPTLVYDPALAYNIGAPPTSPDVAASLAFVSVNKNGAVSSQRPAFWVQGKTLLMDTPSRVRPIINNQLSLLTPPRSSIFVGRVSGEDLLLDPEISRRLIVTHPSTGAQVSDADTFLRTMPSMGGGSSYVRIRPVRLVRYYLEPQADSTIPGAAILKKSVYSDGQFSAPFVIMDQIKTIQFHRESVMQKVMTFSIDKAGQ